VNLHIPDLDIHMFWIRLPNGSTIHHKKYFEMKLKSLILVRISDPHQPNANPDPDPAFHFNADPDPAFHFYAVSDPAPYLGNAKLGPTVSSGLHLEPPRLHFDRPWPSTDPF
jgi:hypothetical protein